MSILQLCLTMLPQRALLAPSFQKRPLPSEESQVGARSVRPWVVQGSRRRGCAPYLRLQGGANQCVLRRPAWAEECLWT